MNKKIFIGFIFLLTSACNLPVSTQTVDSTPTQTPLSAPETVSVTPSLVPTETAVPTLEPLPLYFTDEFDSNLSYWEFLQAGRTDAWTTSIANGSLLINITLPDDWLVGIHTAHTYQNVFVRTTVSLNPTGSAGLICRYSEDGWYEFDISNNGTYSVLYGQWLAPGVVKYNPMINDASKYLTGASVNEVGLFCEDDFLHLYVNNNLLRRVDVTNYGLGEGSVGITAASFADAPMSAVFERVFVTEK